MKKSGLLCVRKGISLCGLCTISITLLTILIKKWCNRNCRLVQKKMLFTHILMLRSDIQLKSLAKQLFYKAFCHFQRTKLLELPSLSVHIRIHNKRLEWPFHLIMVVYSSSFFVLLLLFPFLSLVLFRFGVFLLLICWFVCVEFCFEFGECWKCANLCDSMPNM